MFEGKDNIQLVMVSCLSVRIVGDTFIEALVLMSLSLLNEDCQVTMEKLSTNKFIMEIYNIANWSYIVLGMELEDPFIHLDYQVVHRILTPN